MNRLSTLDASTALSSVDPSQRRGLVKGIKIRGFSQLLATAVLIIGLVESLPSVAAELPIIVVVKLFPAEGREEDVQARLAKLVAFVEKANPGVTFRLHRSAKAPTVFLLYETFPSQSALDSQPKSVLPAFIKEFGPAPEGLFARPNEVEFYRRVGD